MLGGPGVPVKPVRTSRSAAPGVCQVDRRYAPLLCKPWPTRSYSALTSSNLASFVTHVRHMDRAKILELLSLAEKHVADGEVSLQRQRAVVDRLARDGHDAHQARELLWTLEKIQTRLVEERDRLRTDYEHSWRR